MVAPWIALLKAVPWGEVVSHAPAVLSGARKLLKRKPDELAPQAPVPPPDFGGVLSPTEQAAQLHALRNDALSLRDQLTDTQELLQELAEQQARTLAQVDENRSQLDRLRRQLMAVAGVAVVSTVLVVGLLVKVLG
jgi:hypothetical protein